MALGDVFQLNELSGLPIWSSANRSDTVTITSARIAAAASLPPARFLILHFEVTNDTQLGNNEQFEIVVNSSTVPVERQIFTSIEGKDFWSRPIKGNSAFAELVNLMGGAIQSTVRIIDVAWGHPVDIFAHTAASDGTAAPPNILGFYESDIDAPLSGDTIPRWEPIVAAIAPALSADQRRCADATGMFVYVRPRFTTPLEPSASNSNRKIGHSTGVLIDALTVITAGHAAQTEIPAGSSDIEDSLEARSGSITFNYERAAGELQFHKIARHVKHGFSFNPEGETNSDTVDYAVLQLNPVDVPNPPPFVNFHPNMSPPPPANGDVIFTIHHPGGRTKHISRRPTINAGFHKSLIYNPPAANSLPAPFNTYFWYYDNDLDNGSSGAGVFNLAGQLIGIATNVNTANHAGVWNAVTGVFGNQSDPLNWGPRSSRILDDFAKASPSAPREYKIAVVVDTSGSMSSLDVGGMSTKMAAAQKAVEEFLKLIRVTPLTSPPSGSVDNGLHHATLIEFNTNAGLSQQLVQFTAAVQTALTDKSATPNSTSVFALSADGWTSIGDGLAMAVAQFNTAATGSPAASKPRHILLMTDGMENEPDMINTVEATGVLVGVRIDIIGFGGAGNIDHGEMTKLAYRFKGTYTHAQDGLNLKKHYAMIYADIFQTGQIQDPIFTLSAGQTDGDPFPISVWKEKSLTIIVGWDRNDTAFNLQVTSPNGQLITGASPGVEVQRGAGWMFMRFDLPYDGEKNGEWTAQVTRQMGDILRIRAHDAPVTALAYSPSGNWAASGDAAGISLLLDVNQAKAVRGFYLAQPDPNTPRVVGLAFNQAESLLFTAYASQPINTWDVGTGRLLSSYSNFALGQLTCMVMLNHPEINRIAAGGEGGFDLLTLDPPSPQLFRLCHVDLPGVNCLAFSPDGVMLAAGGFNASELTPFLHIYNVSEGECELVMSFEVSHPVTSLTFNPDGNLLVAGKSNGEIDIYDVLGVGLMQTLTEHVTPVTALEITLDGNLLLSSAEEVSGGEPTLVLWDFPSQVVIKLMTGHSGTVWDVTIKPDGTEALSGGADKTIIPWMLPDGEAVGNSLNLEERYFISAAAQSPVYMLPYFGETPWFYYTGDDYYPQVALRYYNGTRVSPSQIEVEITAPTESPGNLLTEQQLESGEPFMIQGDGFNPNTAALFQLQQAATEPLIGTVTSKFDLFDDGQHFDGAVEPDGLFGNGLSNILIHEGHYSIRASGRYGDNLDGSREVTWSIYVRIGIDAGKTEVSVSENHPSQQGGFVATVTFQPRDRYGNYLGTGRRDHFSVQAPPDAELYGVLRDNLDGWYSQDVQSWNSANMITGLYVVQEGRQPTWISEQTSMSET